MRSVARIQKTPKENDSTGRVEIERKVEKKLSSYSSRFWTVAVKYYLKMILPFIVAVMGESAKGQGGALDFAWERASAQA